MIDVTMKDLGSATAGSLIASALLDTLVAKKVLSLPDVRQIVQTARDSVGHPPVGALEREAATILDWMLKVHFAERGGRE